MVPVFGVCYRSVAIGVLFFVVRVVTGPLIVRHNTLRIYNYIHLSGGEASPVKCDDATAHIMHRMANTTGDGIVCQAPKPFPVLLQGQWRVLTGRYSQHSRPVARFDELLWPALLASGTL